MGYYFHLRNIAFPQLLPVIRENIAIQLHIHHNAYEQLQ